MSKILIKLVACHRGKDLRALRKSWRFATLEPIKSGALKGCWRYTKPDDNGKLNTLKISAGCAVEFRPVIRVAAP